MEAKKSLKPSSRPNSAGQKTMEVIAPRQASSESSRARKTPARKLERISSGSTSPSSSFSDFSVIRPSTIDSAEKGRLELLATNPLKPNPSIEDLSKRSHELQEIVREKEAQMLEIQAFVDRMKENTEKFEEEESYDSVMDA